MICHTLADYSVSHLLLPMISGHYSNREVAALQCNCLFMYGVLPLGVQSGCIKWL